MSAFLVQDKTINEVIGMLALSEDLFDTSFFIRKLKDAGYDLRDGGDERLGNAMFALNVRAVEARYRPGTATQFRKLDYRYERCYAIGKIQGLKNLDCWMYQCTEGTIPEDPLYKLMEQIADSIRRSLVSRMPEYEKATWG